MTILFIILSLVLTSLFFIIKKKYSVYKYSVFKDYIYDFSSAHKKQSFKLDNICIDSSYDTAIVEVDVRSTIFGFIIQPYVNIMHKDIIYKQYFEYGAKRKRYITLTLSIQENNVFKIEPKFCTFLNTDADIYLYKNEINENLSLCVIAPHPDDAEIAAYGLYSNNKNSCIVTISASESGKSIYNELTISKEEQAILKGKTRTINSLSAPLFAGVKADSCINYGYFGSTLKKMYENKNEIIPSKLKNIKDMGIFRNLNISTRLLNESYESSWVSLVNDLKYSLEKIKADVIVLPFPDIDEHPDHKYSTLAVIEALKELNIKKGKLLLYTNHHPLSEAYPFGREGSVVGLPPSSNILNFDSIYSHKLSRLRQVDKILALEEMNVLRPYYPWQKSSTIINRVFKNLMNKLYGKRLDYFSRSVRSNELFFVIDIKNIYSKEYFKM